MKSLLFSLISSEERKLLVKTKMPSFMPVMLATLTKKRFSDPEWIFERKFDGERCLVFKKGKTVTLKSRNDKSINASYPEIVDAFKAFDAPDMIVDGELVAMVRGATSFTRLQQRFGIRSEKEARATGFTAYLYIFDLLYIDGYDITQLPLLTRKKILLACMPFNKPLFYTNHTATIGEKLYKQACKKGWEGLIAKYGTGTYVHKRSSQWLKFKCVNEQELVIGGYTDPRGSRTGFGALLVGFYKDNQLHYAGKIGTGYNEATLQKLTAKLKKITTQKNPFVTEIAHSEHTHFVKPVLVAEIGFAEWTRDNKVRHGRFLGLRDDKNPKEVVQEV